MTKITNNPVVEDDAFSGTPRDYSEHLHRVYFEVGEHEGRAGRLIAEYLGPERLQSLVTLKHGYECDLPIQAVPDVVGVLCHENIGVYQVVRIARVEGSWT